ncbi:hypothetical protein ACG2F4_07185 [Halalkalibaculum sp. DA3122]|uniref:hypothetical protein n=1 Tax=Halalkalibaculum sp. DA3122 TaxID=3373607 RepID=UPI003754C5CD
MKLSEKDVKKLKEIKETLQGDQFGSEGYHDNIASNLQEANSLLEVLMWGSWQMDRQGVLSDEHLAAMVTFWQSEYYPRAKEARKILEKISELDI